MHEPDSQPVDIKLLLSSIKTLTNKVNALQKPVPVPKPVPKPENESMKLKTEMAAARAAAEEKKKLQNNELAAARAAAEEKKQIHNNQLAAQRAAAEEKKQMLREQLIAARAAAEEKKQMLREQLMAERAAAEEKKQMLKEEQMLKNELVAVGNEPVVYENFGLEDFTLDEVVFGDEPDLAFETGSDDTNTKQLDMGLTKGEYEDIRSRIVNTNNNMSLEKSSQRTIPKDSEKNDIEAAKRFDILVQHYLKFFDPQAGVNYTDTNTGEMSGDAYNNLNNFNIHRKFPTHAYFPDAKKDYHAAGVQPGNFPGKIGTTGKGNLWTMIDKMPKGGILHIHAGAVCDLAKIFDENNLAGNIYTKSTNMVPFNFSTKKYSGVESNCRMLVNKKMLDDPNFYSGSPDENRLFIVGASEATLDQSQTLINGVYTDVSGNGWYDINYFKSANDNQINARYTGPEVPGWSSWGGGGAAEWRARFKQRFFMSGGPIAGIGGTPGHTIYPDGLTYKDSSYNNLRTSDITYAWNAFDNICTNRYGALRKAGNDAFNVQLLKDGMKFMYDNKTSHLESRIGFVPKIVSGAPPTPEAQNAEIKDAMTKIGQFMRAKPGNGNEFTLRFILAPLRVTTPLAMEGLLESVYIAKSGKRFIPGTGAGTGLVSLPPDVGWTKAKADLISGFDLIGEEDKNNTTGKYTSAWLKGPEFARRYEVPDISFNYYFHDGESNWMTNESVVDAIILGTKRIGHGFNLALRPGLVRKAIEQDICLECCPLSNHILQYTPDVRMHFSNVLFRQGMAMVISNDDPAMYGWTGMTYDYLAAIISWSLNFQQVKRLVYNSLAYSSLTYTERKEKDVNFTIMWNIWTQRIIDNAYGSYPYMHKNNNPIFVPNTH